MARNWFGSNPDVSLEIARQVAAQAATDTAALVPKVKTVKADTTTAYAAVLSDNGKIVTLSNASATALTLPKDSTVAFPIGAEITFIQLGAGLVTSSAESGGGVQRVHGTGAGKFLGQYSVVKAIKIAANTWVLTGDVALS